MSKDISLSKTLSHALRHAPSDYNIHLDPNGWVEITNLIEKIASKNRRFTGITKEDIERIVMAFDKKRFEIYDKKIRAIYGHSTLETIEYSPREPPNKLFHGTTLESSEKILDEGLKSMGRQYAHLSPDIETANQVALRRTNAPVMLKIDSKKAFIEGINFYRGNDKVWLVKSLDSKYITK